MPEFHYHASQSDGQMVHGILIADDQHHLVVQLQTKGLFLVSWNVVVSQEPVSAPTADPPVEATSPGPRFDDRLDAQTPLTRKQKMLLFSILAAGIFIGLFRAYQHHHAKDTTGLLNEKLAQLHEGMTRTEIESIFTESYPGAPHVDKSRYFVPPEFVIEMTYDRNGGQGSAQNHLIPSAQIRIFRASEIEHAS